MILESDNDACKFAMGVWKNKNPDPIFREEDRLRQTLDDQTADFDNIIVRPGQPDVWWVWRCSLKPPYQNTKEALTKLHFDEEAAAQDLGSALVKIMKIIDEHLETFGYTPDFLSDRE